MLCSAHCSITVRHTTRGRDIQTLRIMFDVASLSELLVLALFCTNNFSISIEDNAARARGPLVERDNKLVVHCYKAPKDGVSPVERKVI